ncbi:Nucleotide-binding domain-containing protein [Mycena sanguinolenta]|uniref:Nucleotide-binding domain-containing protein n=1 Tax=Mycena sanguinolenta TaxID=230812 RepID=A0A8H6Z1P6_9AGAR|nr:Nucleotide-binding domain-containing protein [Mycena sanguinolenta]
MGALFSRLRLIYQTLKSISDSFSVLLERISLDPGLPVPNPSRSYWCEPTSPLNARLPVPPLPEYADVVIIGSGIAGTSIARTLLASLEKGQSLRIVMLEARETIPSSRPSMVPARPKAIIRFRLAHLPILLEIAAEEDLLLQSQARTVEQIDAYLQESLYDRAKVALERYLAACPEQRGKHTTQEEKSVLKDFQLSSRVTGCISQTGGALHPYRLITGILSRLLISYPRHVFHSGRPVFFDCCLSFQLFTNTPCTAIDLTADGTSYKITTPTGTLETAHVVHATNAWASHLLPGMRRKIVPVRAHMTAQRPGIALGQGEGWLAILDGDSLQPTTGGVDGSSTSDPYDSISSGDGGEMMFGGGAMLGGRAEAAIMDNIGVSDESETDFEVTAYLGGAGTAPTTEKAEEGRQWRAGRIKAAWSGIIAISADGQPWIGRIPRCVTDRDELRKHPPPPSRPDNPSLAHPGEWIAAGFNGEGMTHAWLAGAALARMLLNDSNNENAAHGETALEVPPLPLQFVITEKRWREADIESFFGRCGVWMTVTQVAFSQAES